MRHCSVALRLSGIIPMVMMYCGMLSGIPVMAQSGNPSDTGRLRYPSKTKSPTNRDLTETTWTWQTRFSGKSGIIPPRVATKHISVLAIYGFLPGKLKAMKTSCVRKINFGIKTTSDSARSNRTLQEPAEPTAGNRA